MYLLLFSLPSPNPLSGHSYHGEWKQVWFRVHSVGSLGPHGKSGSRCAFKRQLMIQVIGAQSHLLSGKHGKNSLITGAGGRSRDGMCHNNQVPHDIIKLGLGVGEVGQRQQFIEMCIIQAEMGKQMRDARTRCPMNWKILMSLPG